MRNILRLLVAALACAIAPWSAHAVCAAAVAPADLEVIVAIDTSGSMGRAIGAAKDAANEFITALPPDVRIGVETFGDTVNVLTAPTSDRDRLRFLLSGIRTGGHTALYDAVVAAGPLFSPDVANKVLVVVSDGRDDGSATTLDQAVAAVQGVHVEAISVTTAETDLASLSALGTVTAADDEAGLAAAFVRIGDLLAQDAVPGTSEPVPTSVAPTAPTATTTASAPAVATDSSGAPVESAAPAPEAAPATSAPSSARSSAPSSARLWLGAGGLFVALFVLGFLLLPRERVSKERLGIDAPSSVSEVGKRTIGAVEGALQRHGKRDDIAEALSVAHISMGAAEFVAVVALGAVVGGSIGLLLGGPLPGLMIAIGVCLLSRWAVSRSTRKRRAAFAEQLPDVLQLVTTALRSGFGLTQALESVAEEAEEPARAEFARVLVEARYGRDLSEAMRALAVRMRSDDLEWVVGAIDINRETGGNLSEILNTVGATIRDRQRMSRHVDTLTAEGRLSARILTVMPFLMGLWQWKTNPTAFALLTHGPGLGALIIGGLLMVLGTIWVRAIVNSIST